MGTESATTDIRWLQRFEHLEKAWSRLQSACAQASYSELESAGLVKTFEFSFELAWKTLKDVLDYEGYEVNSPRETLRQGFSAGYISDGALWLEALESRNRLSHVYDAQTAAEAERLIKFKYAPMIGSLVESLRERSL